MIFHSFQVIYDAFYKPTSACDVGTMFSNMNIINNVNAKTKNALDNFNSCKEYVNFETDAMIVASALQHFGMQDIDTPAELVIPPNILQATKKEKRVWLHKHARQLLETFVMKTQKSVSEEIVNEVGQANQPRSPTYCRICNKEYRYPKARDNHEKHQHPEFTPPQDQDLPETPTVGSSKNGDDRYNYACSRLTMGLLLRNFDDAIKEGDGERIMRCWKFSMLIFTAFNHTKYALASFMLQASIEATLTPRQAHSLVWNRTVNCKGGTGRNISLDLRLEHLNNLLKGLLKNLGANVVSENSALRCSRSIGFFEKLLEEIDNDLNVNRPSGHHKVTKSESDFRAIVAELHVRGSVFKYNPSPERQYVAFNGIQQNILIGKLNYKKLNDWLSQKKSDLHKFG